MPKQQDLISLRVLKSCAAQLSDILQHIFNLSLLQERIPVLWKTPCIVPVPKKSNPSGLNDFRPVAITSRVMKVLERLILSHLRPLVKPALNPLQFAYQPRVDVNDAVIYLRQRAHSHLDGGGDTVKIMFFDFSSASPLFCLHCWSPCTPLIFSTTLNRATCRSSVITLQWPGVLTMDRSRRTGCW